MRSIIVQFELDDLPKEKFKNLHEYVVMLERRAIYAETKEWCAKAPDDWLLQAEQFATGNKSRRPRLRKSRIANVLSYTAASWENAMDMNSWIRRFHAD